MTEKVVIGDAELWYGDCREVLPGLGRFDLLLTDPPYGFGYARSPVQAEKSWRRIVADTSWDDATPPRDLLDVCIGSARVAIIWGGNYFGLPASSGWLVWRKPDRVPSCADVELAWTSLDMNARIIEHSISATNAERCGHPTQKPLRVMTWCLGFAPDANTVCDPFMGSGTTGVACVMAGKAFTGIERERKYFDLACERIARAYAQPRLFPDAKVSRHDTAEQGALL